MPIETVRVLCWDNSLTVIYHLRVLVDFFEYPSDVLPGSRRVAGDGALTLIPVCVLPAF